jgi:hypothetical protein
MRDCVVRLNQFHGEHPNLQLNTPVMGRYGHYTALIPPQTIPGEHREISL